MKSMLYIENIKEKGTLTFLTGFYQIFFGLVYFQDIILFLTLFSNLKLNHA